MGVKKTLNTDEVIERLSKRYSQPEYGFLTQVRNGAGFSATRTMDAMAMSLWPSRGLHITGFEVKVSRGDFIREIRNPQKADELACFCDYWYIVVGDPDIVQLGELPEKWGLIVPSGTGLKIIKEAVKLTPQPIDASFLAALMRNLTKGMIPSATIAGRMSEEFERGKTVGASSAGIAPRELKSLQDKVKAFETASGVELITYKHDSATIGEAVKVVLEGRDKVIREKLEKMGKSAANIQRFIKGEIDSWSI